MENICISKIFKFKLDTKDTKVQKLGIAVNQYDSIILKINITENKVSKDLTNCKASLMVLKENGELERQSTGIDITDQQQGVLDVKLKNSCVDITGVCMAQLVISDEDEVIRTPKFLIVVNEVIDGEIIVEASNKISAIEELDQKIDTLFKDTYNSLAILNDKIADYGNLFSGDYNDLVNKPEIPIVDVTKAYVDEQLLYKASTNNVYSIEEVYTKYEVHEIIDNIIVDGLIDLGSYAKTEWVTMELEGKVEKVADMGLSHNDFTNEDKIKLNSLENYEHPNNANTRHITDAERLYWNEKADNKTVTTSANGLMTPAQRSKLEGISAYANNYSHPTTHPASIIIQDKNNRFVNDEQIEKWNSFMDNISGLATIQYIDEKFNQTPKSLQGVNWLNIGDSLSAYSGSEYGYSNPKTWSTVASEITGATIKNCAVAGAGLGSIEQLMNITNTTTSDIANAQIITIMLYGNDLLDGLEKGSYTDVADMSGTTCCARLKGLVNYIQQYNKTAPIIFIQEPMRLDGFGANSWGYATELRKTCNYLQIPYFDLAKCCGFNENNYDIYYHTDKLHLKPLGYKTIGGLNSKAVCSFFVMTS